MKFLPYLVYILFLLGACNARQEESNKEVESTNNEQDLPKSTQTEEQTINPKQYVYVKLLYMVDVDETGSFKTFVRSSNIIEVTSLDEDKKAKIISKYLESI